MSLQHTGFCLLKSFPVVSKQLRKDLMDGASLLNKYSFYLSVSHLCNVGFHPLPSKGHMLHICLLFLLILTADLCKHSER